MRFHRRKDRQALIIWMELILHVNPENADIIQVDEYQIDQIGQLRLKAMNSSPGAVAYFLNCLRWVGR